MLSFCVVRLQIQPIVSGVVYDNKLFTGAATGHLYMWVDRTVARSVQGTTLSSETACERASTPSHIVPVGMVCLH
jgi:hypothetical protein